MSAAAKTPFETTVDAQRIAADPIRSAFVAANAGSGKTRVLTDRVARLLLTGVAPSKILCITYTKAAAAEMAHRLFELLGGWALADDKDLIGKLEALEGVGAPRRTSDLAQARRLFARALETPGGLKIQTIHSFCESVLKRFPLEARVAPGFVVLDENTSAALANAAINETASLAAESSALAAAFARLALRLQPEFASDRRRTSLRRLLGDMICARQKLDDALAAAGDWGTLRVDIAAALGVAPGESADAIITNTIAVIDRDQLRRAESALNASGGNPEKLCGQPIGAFFAAADIAGQWAALRKLFIKTDGDPRGAFGTKRTADIDPAIEALLKDWQAAFVEADARAKAAENFADTDALLTITEKALANYETLKAARAGLDYDDLIDRVETLFKNSGFDWVRCKLDQGLDHILLDEAQDTSPAQWDVVEGPLDEFFAGGGARETHRTFFAVGDQKQSIYSFQGADANLFAQKQLDLGKRISAVMDFKNVPLTLSFRTTAPLLDFVDALFADPSVIDGVGAAPLEHSVSRRGEAGLVELWPRVPRPQRMDANAWDAPVDAPPPANPVHDLTTGVAQTIKRWLDSNELLESKGRPITPGDIMILVQSRGPLFHAMIRALTGSEVPVAGVDKIKLLEEAVIEDLLSYARCVLLEEDDLSLAETLKSPFFSIDDGSLYDLAYGRQDCLWRTLAKRANERAEWRRAADEIGEARAIGLREGAFVFFSHVLETGAPPGRKRLYARLGEAASEPIAEFMRQALDYELANPRSLQSFVVWAEKHAGEIKRDMEQAANAVRVMTVHGAKGLEAEVVFLLDAHRGPTLQNLGPLFFARGSSGDIPIISLNRDGDSAAAGTARRDAVHRAYAEYRRLLYVAATRARDRLYICGLELGNEKDPHAKAIPEKSWHALAEDAFDKLAEFAISHGETPWGGAIRQISCAQTAAIKVRSKTTAREMAASPAWASMVVAPEEAPIKLSPARLSDDAEAVMESPAFSPLASADRLQRGRTLHRLLELLPDLPPADRSAAADRLLARLAPAVAAGERNRWREEVLAVLSNPDFAPVFAPTSRAEVALAGAPRGARRGVIVSGQVDRLAVAGGRVLIVDYKTNRPPPQALEEISPAYLAQLAAYRALLQEIYPNHQIDAALLWTFESRLTPIPSAMLDHAFARTLG